MHSLLFNYFEAKTGINQESFEFLRDYFKPIESRRNEYLLRSGRICHNLYFVNEGCLRLYTTNMEGKEVTRYFAFKNKFGTALSSFINQQPSFEFIQSLEPTELLVIHRTDFYYLVDTNPHVNRIYRDMLEMAYTTSQERIYGLQGDSALERLRWLLEYQPNILTRLSSKVISSYLGVTPYTLSRLKAEL